MDERSDTVTVIGLGAMGSALVRALRAAGRPVTVWNRTPARADPLVELGAVRAPSAASAARSGALVVLCLLDVEAVHAVLDEVGEAIAGATVVDLATMTPDDARGVADRVRSAGAEPLTGVMMAVPVQVGTPEATFLYGGAAEAFARHGDDLRTLAGSSALLGDDHGLPGLYDTALLTLLYATMTGWLQAFAVVGSAGVPAKELVPHAQAWFDSVVTADDPAAVAAAIDAGEYPDTVPSSVALNAAALRLLAQVHDEAGVDSGLVRAIGALAERRVADGHGDDGYTSLVEAIRSGRSAA
jgi:3-hydroxyisobutyrate dehydrogenase-like beta-hydroxyacid dehydrogenase